MGNQKQLQMKTKRNFHIKYTSVLFTRGPVINADHKECISKFWNSIF
jgi:hypothetical protein